jgi:hypothetical protein
MVLEDGKPQSTTLTLDKDLCAVLSHVEGRKANRAEHTSMTNALLG